MKTRFPHSSVIVAILVAMSVHGNFRASAATAGDTAATSSLRLPGTQSTIATVLADTYSPGVQGMFQDSAQGEPFESLHQPWYVSIWPENRILRILIFGGIIMGIKALISRGSGGKANSRPQQAGPQTQQPPFRPVTTPLPAATQQATSGWFYHSNGSDIGPFDEGTLRQIKNAGVIHFDTLIRRADGGNWINFSDVFGSN